MDAAFKSVPIHHDDEFASICKIFTVHVNYYFSPFPLSKMYIYSVVQMRRYYWDNLVIICHHFFIKTYFMTPSLELSHQDGSNEGSQHMFSLRNNKNNLLIIFSTPTYLEVCKLFFSPIFISFIPLISWILWELIQ